MEVGMATRRKKKTGMKAALMAIVAAGMSGCVQYSIETTLNPDGSGSRKVKVEATDAHRLEEDNVTHEEFLAFMSLSKEDGWIHDVEIQSDGDTTYTFARERTIDELNSWSELNDDIHILGPRGFSADSTIGYVKLGDVQFRNSVRVRSGGNESGEASFSFQETFRWTQALDVFLEGIVAEMGRSLELAYPDLPERDMGEILGGARASLWAATEDGLLDTLGDDDDLFWPRVLDQTVAQGIKIVRTKYPRARAESLRRQLDLLAGGDPLDRFDYLLPGLSTAMNTEITFHLTMPGSITTTNAHSREGNRLTWEFTPTDALEAPIVLVAESVVGG
jgi:hypothetical protein